MSRGSLLIRGGRIIEPCLGVDMVGDLLIVNGEVAWMGEGCPPGSQQADITILARGMVVSPGFVDLHVHLREPGFEE